MTAGDRYWQTARTPGVLTERQLRVLELRDQYGFSLRLISWTTGVSIWTVRTHLDAARLRVNQALEKETAA